MRATKQNVKDLQYCIETTLSRSDGGDGTIESWRKIYRDAGQSERRFIWDLCWATRSEFLKVTEVMYAAGLHDDHIETAIKAAVRQIERGGDA